ncbi:hypothetical protein [Kordiimonas sp.]|uniref:hypothetical protein n=1 Tax=Kordiimonas sp. TaxID=1970157 RepID=UPI003A8EBB33
MGMNFEERKMRALDLIIDFMDRFVPPRGLSEGQQSKQLVYIADAFARKMPPSTVFDEAVAAVLDRVADTHMSLTWPHQATFVMAMPTKDPAPRSAHVAFSPENPWELMANRMQAGEAVSESMLWSQTADATLPREQLDNYRRGSVRQQVDTYKHAARQKMLTTYGSVVEPYFDELETSLRSATKS